MSSRKLNEFLDASGSDDDDHSQGYNSDADVVQKGGRTTKRRKVDSDEDNSLIGSDEDSEVENSGPAIKSNFSSKKRVPSAGEDKLENDIPDLNSHANEETGNDQDDITTEVKKSTVQQDFELPGVTAPLSKKNLVATEKAVKRSGVVYLSRIPPFMKPQKLRSLLEPYGTINRIFLTPEDPTSHSKRVRNGGNKKRSFTDGWVEFVSKAKAKEACELLNARTIGGKKGGYYCDDVWNLLYLKGFKWRNLTEQIASENAERSSRMRAEISRTSRENREFVANVEQAKKLEGMKSKEAAKKRKADEEREAGGGESAVVGDVERKGRKAGRAMNFKQTAVATKKTPVADQEQVKKTLSMIF